MTINSQKNNFGFTLIEMLVVLAIGSFVLIAALSFLTNMLRIQKSSSQINNALVSSEVVFNQITNDVYASKEVKVYDTQLDLVLEDDTLVTYLLSGQGQITRNGQPLTHPTINAKQFRVIARSDPAPSPLFEVKLTLETKSTQFAPVTIDRNLVLSARINSL